MLMYVSQMPLVCAEMRANPKEDSQNVLAVLHRDAEVLPVSFFWIT